jgi:hypothetical protein
MRLAPALLVVIAACGGAAPAPPAPPPPPDDPLDTVPAGPLAVVSTHEGETSSETVEDVHFRDAKGAVHALLVHYTSYPVLPSLVTLDDKTSPQGPAWGRLGKRLRDAGLKNNATYLLMCFGGNVDRVC